MNLTIDEVLEEVYEDLDGRITGVQDHPDGLLITYECADWRTEGARIQLRLLCREAVDWTVTVGSCGWFGIEAEHPLLIQRHQPWQDIYFSSAPEQPAEFLQLVQLAHQELFGDWIPLPGFIHANVRWLREGNGLLARGPRDFITKVSALAQGRLQTYIRPPGVPTDPPDPRFIAAIFQTGYVVCRNFELLGHSPVD